MYPRGPDVSFSQCPGLLGTHPILKHNTQTSSPLAPHHLATVTVLTCVISHCLFPHIGHLYDYHHGGHGHLAGRTESKRSRLLSSGAHPQPHSTPSPALQAWPKSLSGSWVKAWFLTRGQSPFPTLWTGFFFALPSGGPLAGLGFGMDPGEVPAGSSMG